MVQGWRPNDRRRPVAGAGVPPHAAPTSTLSDESLLAGMASGDHEAAGAFVHRFQARVYGLALTILRDAPVAEEVAQEAFLRAWRHAGAYDARRGAVSTWLLVITRNLALDVIRLHRTLPVDPDFIIALPNAENEDGPEEKGIAADQVRRVREAVAALPEEQQRALILATIYGRTAREIGEAEGIPLGTAKTRIRSTLLKLRSTLRADGR